MKKRTGSLFLSLCLIVSLCVGFMVPVSAYNYSTDHPNTHTNTGVQRSDVVAIAATQVGYAEANDGSTKYGAWWHEYVASTYYDFVTADWCAIFINWCAAQAGASNVYASKSALCSYILSTYQSGQSGNAAYAFGSGYTPRPGDIIFVNSYGGAVNHNGLIVEVTDDTIYTIEGNSSDKVSRVSYSLETGYRTGSYRQIAYFGVPNYANDSEANFDNTTSVAPGTDSSDDVGTAVDSYTVTVTAQSGLNVRVSPSASAIPMSGLAYNATVTIVAEATDSSGNLWGKLSSGGWICLKYTSAYTEEEDSSVSITEITAYTAVVSCDSLNVRNAPGLSGSKVNSLTKGATVTVSAIANVDDMEWGRIGDDQWIATAYLTASTTDEPGTEVPDDSITEIPGDSTTETPDDSMTETPDDTTTETPDDSATETTGTVYTVTGSSVNLRTGAGTNYTRVGSVSKGDTITIVATSGSWGQLDNGNWICMDYVKKTDSGSSTGGTTGGTTSGTAYTVTGTNVNIRSGAGTGYAIVGTANKGDMITIVATNGSWGQLDNGNWIYMVYTKAAGTGSSTGGSTGGSSSGGTTTSGTTYTVTGSNVNIRSGAGTGYAIVGTANKGDTVTIVATNGSWGQLDNGNWIYMVYTKAAGTGSSTGGSTGSTAAGTTYTATTGVNIRSGAGTGYAIVGSVYAGQTVTIVATSGNWGQMANGNWICLDYFRT